MKIAIDPRPASPEGGDLLVLFAAPGQPPSWGRDIRITRRLRQLAAELRFGARAGEVAHVPTGALFPRTGVLLVGLGDAAEAMPRSLKYAAACAARCIRRLRVRTCRVKLPESASLPDAVQAFILGFRRGSYQFTAYRETSDLPPARVGLIVRDVEAVRRAVRAAEAMSDEFDRVADLANGGGNDSTPARIAAFARERAGLHGLTCTVWDHRRLLREGCRAHAAVGQGSANPPCLIRLDYRPRQPRGGLVALVGKTITFDSGGLSIKPAKSMESMKYDKCGGMAVLAALFSAARLRVPRPITAILAVAENMTGSRAQRPGDIVRTRAGHTVEVLNTDAEGRLVLADALDVAADLKPQAIIDLATLTGAAVTALGRECSAILGQSEPLLRSLADSGERCGERLWRLPLHPEYRGLIRTPLADLRNIGDGTAGTIVGGIFLQHFVSPAQPWAHIDLTHAWDERDQPYAAAGANLFGAHLLVDWLVKGESA